jgi:membrane protease YdiL (CAAX protease family)
LTTDPKPEQADAEVPGTAQPGTEPSPLDAYRSPLTEGGPPDTAAEAGTVVPWTWLDVIVVAVLYIASGMLGREVVKAVLGISEAETSQLPPALWLAVLLGSATGLVIGVALAALWLRLAARATWAEMGLRADNCWRYARLGFLSFLLLMVPIYGLQFVLAYLYEQWYGGPPPQNPLIDHLREHPDAIGFVVAGLLAVVIAPLTEEFVFRAVLQGWLERVAARAARDPNAVEGAAESGTMSPLPWPVLVVPIVASSLIFALMHYTHGVAWIPLFFFALGLGYLYQRTRSLVAPIVLHACLNACTMLILWLALRYGLPNLSDH